MGCEVLEVGRPLKAEIWGRDRLSGQVLPGVGDPKPGSGAL